MSRQSRNSTFEVWYDHVTGLYEVRVIEEGRELCYREPYTFKTKLMSVREAKKLAKEAAALMATPPPTKIFSVEVKR